MHRTPRFLLAVLSLLAVALSACGGIGDKSAQDVLSETFGPGKSVKSGDLDLRIAFAGPGLPGLSGPLKLGLKGPFSSSGGSKLPQVDLDASVDLGGQALSAGVISTGDKGFFKFGGANFAIADATYKRFAELYQQDRKANAKQGGAPAAALGVDPRSWLAAPEKAGEEDVGATKTVHVTSKVDVPAFLGDLNKLLGRADATGAAAAAGAGAVPTKLSDPQRALIAASVKNATLDVFAGKDDGILRRLNLQITFDVPADRRKDAGGLTAGTFGLDLVINGLNEKQAIKAPSAARPLSDLTQRGATGTSGAAPSTDGGTAAPQADPSSTAGRYRACLDAAGASIAKAQQCAPLLGGG